MYIELETNLIDLLVSFDYDPGSKDTRNWECPMGMPGDPPSVKIKGIYIGKSNGTIEIKNFLSSKEINRIEEACLEQAQIEE